MHGDNPVVLDLSHTNYLTQSPNTKIWKKKHDSKFVTDGIEPVIPYSRYRIPKHIRVWRSSPRKGRAEVRPDVTASLLNRQFRTNCSTLYYSPTTRSLRNLKTLSWQGRIRGIRCCKTPLQEKALRTYGRTDRRTGPLIVVLRSTQNLGSWWKMLGDFMQHWCRQNFG